MIKTFVVGKKYISTCWFTGGNHEYTYLGDNTFNVGMMEADGFHSVKEKHEILKDEEGEYILLYEYNGHKNILHS